MQWIVKYYDLHNFAKAPPRSSGTGKITEDFPEPDATSLIVSRYLSVIAWSFESLLRPDSKKLKAAGLILELIGKISVLTL